MKIFKSLTAVAGLVAIVMTLQGNGCFGGNDVVGVNGGGGGGVKQTGEQFCSGINSSYGHMFFCGTTQANLQQAGMPSGVFGYCGLANSSMGLVGYSEYLSNGLYGFVETQSQASSDCNNTPGCLGYIMCTRQ
jgi:hypothetical protein